MKVVSGLTCAFCLAAGARGATIAAVSGPMYSALGVGSGNGQQAQAMGFSTSKPLANVTITAPISDTFMDAPITAYLTSTLGPGTTAGDVIAQSNVVVSVNTTNPNDDQFTTTTFFSNLVTSLPDHSELPGLGVDGWRAWFIDTVSLACRALADDAVAIFYQSDVKHDGRWIDKGHMVMTGVDASGSALLWHKIVCRAPAGTITWGRPSYSHMLCVSRALRIEPGVSSADVLPQLGEM
ncbi:MAG: hypothetical protein ACTHM6_11545, partial [Tepidisphaeraceae bacterium]